MFKQVPPGEGGVSRPAQFSYVGTLPGQTWYAFAAGPIQWLKCHTREDLPSKPCLRWITDGALPCPRCTKTWHLEPLGYTPLYRESDHREVMVILREPARDLAAGIEFPNYVCVSRDHGKADSTVVTRAPKQKKWMPTLPRRQVPADLEYSLLTMWKINELSEWCKTQGGRTMVPPIKEDLDSTPEDGAGKVPFPVKEVADMLDANADKAAERARQGHGMAAWFRSRVDGEKNGKPHT